jgi:hypothetical protein
VLNLGIISHYKIKILLIVKMCLIFKLHACFPLGQAEITSFHLLRSLLTPFASSTVIKFLTHARRFQVRLTWPSLKLFGLIWSRKFRLGFHTTLLPTSASQISYVNLLSSILFKLPNHLNIFFSWLCLV